ncbi:hypothetical protein HYALB_00005157 [Hymenoscyphus albidus]|uniref:mRNA export factor GLE1 n=1 Tax=Hymenoscyphus albidus TaxID=595503 RepID=A0A9N9LRJ1_9HELO|nr:hypothetical protein HYALB_00005157 [Hymenoscyphus albidus]
MGDSLPRNDDPASLLGRSFLGLDTFEYRNSEQVHRDALAAAQAEHARVREVAVRAYELHEARLAQVELYQRSLQEEERVRIETARAEAEVRLREIENAAKRIPIPPPRLPTPPPPPPPVPRESEPAAVVATPPPANTSQQQSQIEQQPVSTTPSILQPPTQLQPARSPFVQAQARTTQPQNLFQPPAQSKTAQAAPPFQQNTQSQALPNVSQQQQPIQKPIQQPEALKPVVKQSSHHLLWTPERYLEIFQNLKKLRKYIREDSASKPTKELKNQAGNLKRSIVASLGKLTLDVKLNNGPKETIMNALRQARDGGVPSIQVDPSLYMISKPEPTEGARNNGETMPALFLYLLNILAKGIVKQLINEAGPAPKAAEKIGFLTVAIFSQSEFLWRGHTMIDILMAKMRVSCPVLFGFRGLETTIEGRAVVGWKRDKEGNKSFVAAQVHSDRMTGLGAGYASICLRDFSKSAVTSPWKPWHYWQTLATITSTPPEEACSTQFTVLKAMIEFSEQKFLKFYGSAGVAALRVALVDFPENATQKGAANMSLAVLADKLLKDTGLRLRQ